MLSNYINFVKDIEDDKRTRYGVSVVVTQKTGKTANPSADVKSFYEAAKDPDEDAYTFTETDITIQSMVVYLTEDDLAEIESGILKVGDAVVEMPIARLALLQDAVRDKYKVTIGTVEYLAVEVTSHPIKTIIEVGCQKILQ